MTAPGVSVGDGHGGHIPGDRVTHHLYVRIVCRRQMAVRRFVTGGRIRAHIDADI